LPQHGAGSLACRVAGTLLGCKPQNDFHFLQGLQLHHSEFRQTDGDTSKNAAMNIFQQDKAENKVVSPVIQRASGNLKKCGHESF
jgi:hypothetical protein